MDTFIFGGGLDGAETYIKVQVLNHSALPSTAGYEIGDLSSVMNGEQEYLSSVLTPWTSTKYKYPPGLYQVRDEGSGKEWFFFQNQTVTALKSLIFDVNDDWVNFFNATPVVKANSIINYLGVRYVNLTGSLTITAPNLDTTNWGSYIQLNPSLVAPSHQAGRRFYDAVENTFVSYNDIPDVALNEGEELWIRCKNNTGSKILNGSIVFISGADTLFPTVEPAIASSFDESIRTFGVTTMDIHSDGTYGNQGYVTRFGAVREVNTLGCVSGDIIYLSTEDPGKFTIDRPVAPNYVVRIGIIIIVDEFQGVIGVDTLAFNGSDTSVNIEGFLNGTVTNTPQVDISVSGSIIYADITNEDFPSDNLPFLIGGKLYKLNTTTSTGVGGAAQVVVPPGASSTEKQLSFVYIYLNSGVPTLSVSTIEPSIPYAQICQLTVFDATRTLADGKPFGYRRYNNAIDNLNGVNDGSLGGFVETLNAIRLKLGSNWLSGQVGTPTVNDTTIRLALTVGRGAQFRRTTTPAFDGLSYLIYNDDTNGLTYENSTNLTDIEDTASGTTLLANNRYYTIRLFYMLNSNGIGNSVIATRPLSFYTTPDEAVQDAQNFAVSVNDTDIEEIVYPLYDIVIGRTGGGGTTITLIEMIDKRSKLAGGGGGGGGAAGGGILIATNLTTSERDSLSAANGMIIYNTTTNVFNFYENGAWVTK